MPGLFPSAARGMTETEKFFGGVNRFIALLRSSLVFIAVLLIGSLVSEDWFDNLWGFFAIIGIPTIVAIVFVIVKARSDG